MYIGTKISSKNKILKQKKPDKRNKLKGNAYLNKGIYTIKAYNLLSQCSNSLPERRKNTCSSEFCVKVKSTIRGKFKSDGESYQNNKN